MSTQGFIFDLDGVIVDTAKYHYLAWKNLANNLGFDFTEEQNELFKGVSRVESLKLLLEIGDKTISQEEFNQLLISKNEEYLEYIEKMDASEILPDVPKVLMHLKDEKAPIALGSASKNATPILEKVQLLSYFDTIVDGNDVTKAKPDPEVFLLGAQQLNIPAEQCIVFEDSIAGIQAANKANMISIGIGDAKVLHEADHVFDDFTKISIQFLNKLIAG
ncbi:beta-phosphoglucomutase [Spongiivirga citrea]|uniref:Beta-phosphoglucomutase n=1 Tax=Spongiivirga citrea TaxID=1481457 RepID=A0A6M0CGD3_9FLAO|nr:beta-phosphoglucomutase [Spongiivirga citrea]NER16915.1 beta-phosphoglucomutase [Spongiivirga citrea]